MPIKNENRQLRKREKQSANELIDIEAAQGRHGKPQARGPRYGKRHGQDFNPWSQGPGVAFGFTPDARL